MIRLFNTRTRHVEDFTPQLDDTVSLYTCGPTVYSEPLIGNWVAYIRWDLLVRTLRTHGYKVNRVMNITDVGHLVSDADDGEDKMQKGARREGVSAWEIADRYTNRFLEGMTELNLLPPEQLPKATEHIADQIQLIQQLEESGHTYRIRDGIYFDTSTFPAYADFAHLDLEALRAGARVEQNTEKRNPTDFALWKFSPTDARRDMEWESPWGTGFPGWHIECSAMAIKYLGETLDIHTGGIDHIPVHHTNEIAQSEAVTGKQFAKFWLHANFLLIDGTKVSKSLGNGYTLTDVKERGFSPLDFKMFVLQSHYRTESNFTWDNLSAAKSRLAHWKVVASLRWQTTRTASPVDETISSTLDGVLAAATDTLSNDLNSPLALTHIEEGLDLIERTALEQLDAAVIAMFLQRIDDALGLELIATTPDINEEAKQLLKERDAVRETKQWQRSDEIRNQLEAQGIGINDTPSGAVWYWLG